MSPLVTPNMFSHKSIEKQLDKLVVSDKAMWLNSPLPGLLWSILADRKIVYILERRNFLLRFPHTNSSTRYKATKFNFSKVKNLFKKA